MTRHRHVRSGERRQEKDDRDETVDPRHFILGWDNKEKKQHIAAEIARLQQYEMRCSREIDRIEDEIGTLQQGLTGLVEAGRLETYRDIDFAVHEAEIERLEAEKRKLESDSDVIPMLRERLAEARSRE